jgi:uncharacterized protein (TIGR03382 family)
VNAGIVAFESVPVGDTAADILVYDIANNLLYQVTDSPGVAETLNDVFVLPNGKVRVVWAEGPEGDRDVRGADLELPPPNTCNPTTVSLTASVSYHPHGWVDGEIHQDDLAFNVPASIPTTEGNAGNGTLWLSFSQTGGDEVKCLYSGDGKTGDGRTSSNYVFHHCTMPSVTDGTAVVADHVRVRVQNADAQVAKTSVGFSITVECPETVAGCSSTGGTFTFAALAFALLMWMMPRRASVPVRNRRPTR